MIATRTPDRGHRGESSPVAELVARTTAASGVPIIPTDRSALAATAVVIRGGGVDE